MGKINCPSCQAEMYDTEAFCPACGAPHRPAGAPEPAPAAAAPQREPVAESHSPHKWLILLAVAAIAVGGLTPVVMAKMRMAGFVSALSDEVNKAMSKRRVTQTTYRRTGPRSAPEKVSVVSVQCGIRDLRVIKPQKGADRIWYFEGRRSSTIDRENPNAPKKEERTGFWKLIYGATNTTVSMNPEDKVNGVINWQKRTINVDYYAEVGGSGHRFDFTLEYTADEWQALCGAVAPARAAQ